MAKKSWSDDENVSLLRDFGSMSRPQLVTKYRRPYRSICAQAYRLGAPRPQIRIGARFGSWVIEGVEGGRRKSAVVVCDCGSRKTLSTYKLTGGASLSCGCGQHNRGDGKIGERYGRLVVVGDKLSRPCGQSSAYAVPCLCDCGRRSTPFLFNLRSGVTMSCGCLKSDATSLRSRTHGQSRTRLYRLWASMIQRCGNANQKSWPRYGGRGIQVCEEWRVSFERFRNWSLDNGYDDSLSLDRHPDHGGNYCPENCRWATVHEQANNRSNNHTETVWGETKTVAEWSHDSRCVVPYEALLDRLNTCGWGIERALTTPIRKGATGDTRLKRQARMAVKSAVKSGRLIKPRTCSVDGCAYNGRVEAHHHKGYERENWLDVEWLCNPHHKLADVRDNR